ncbi:MULTISPECIES: phytanoyl-CoA dioxygenase family protein [unclassified Pseudomonas]|uniref:phytanoyl-CoA dioxygenase family protein n=1 Tax=unclassified Pseudomonas TaxID=196821 RepID=UPI0024473926|nr:MULTISPECIES: phytanoyl-CoA dioxygenase family protein [unclassified Pseudomonas]MDG9928577.1 phytanoyl-CoA dioxygenase family protein [Pseudomonas sp. GD04042]MDH0482747.1 phytanoyl-CoA dioxygenase family protein [Pseudomonas sp. GD04015]MDH0607235.1 phytanoyl-CoA dioxygenase family protein [Pseudomonas sp. GD03869]
MGSYAEQFDRDGFCIIPNAISSGLVEKANLAINAFRKKNDSLLMSHDLLVEGLLQRVVNFHHSVRPLRDIFVAAMSAGCDVVDQYGEATLYTSLFFELGSQQPLHRDTPYFYSGGDAGYMGVWVALDDVDENNGALVAVRGSHKIPDPDIVKLREQFFPDGNVPPSHTPLFNAYNEAVLEMTRQSDMPIVTCKVKAGDMIIWNPATLHGGLPHLNKALTRRSFVMHITPENMPMKNMDYFFDRDKVVPPVQREYSEYCGRKIVSGAVVDFRHIKHFSLDDLGLFD